MNLKKKLSPVLPQISKNMTKNLFILALLVPISSPADIVQLGNKPIVLMKANTPKAGMSMSKVLRKFGQPGKRQIAPGKVTSRNPLITRWYYGKSVVYFENKHVIHTVIRR